MAYNLIVKEEALADTLEAYLYYEDKLEGLGAKFLKSLQNSYDHISLHPQFYSFTDNRNQLRDIKLKGFPYVVIFDFTETDVTVYVVHN